MSGDGVLAASDSWLLAFTFWLFGRAQAKVLGGALAPLEAYIRNEIIKETQSG